MTRLPGLEATILRTLEEQGEVRPPLTRIAQEYFWLAASRLQAQGKVVADQRAGVVRRPAASTFVTDASAARAALSPAQRSLIARGWSLERMHGEGAWMQSPAGVHMFVEPDGRKSFGGRS